MVNKFYAPSVATTTYGAELMKARQIEEMKYMAIKKQWDDSRSSVAVGYSQETYHPGAMRALHHMTKAAAAKAAAGLVTQQQPLTYLCGQIDVLMHSLKTAYDPATVEELDALLSEHPDPDIVWQAMHAWQRNAETPGTNTWLTHAVTEAHIEAIAVLLYHGADPLQQYPQRGNVCALDDASVHYHNRERDPTNFHLIATLLNSSIFKTDPAKKKGYMITGGSDEPFGIDPNAPILDHHLKQQQGEWDRQSSQRPLAVLDFVHLRVTQIIFYYKKAKLRLSYLEKD
jgi:hypothetical protein